MKKIISVLISLAALLGLILAPSAAFAAGPSENARCMGIESAAVSPPGSSDEEPGGRAQIAHEVKELSTPPGAFDSFFAQLNEGSHEACDAALGE